MKKIALLLISVLLISCSDDVKTVYTGRTIYYYSYVSRAVIDKASLGLDDFNPDAPLIKGDTLFFADNISGKQSVYMYSLSKNKSIGNLRSWNYNDATQSFPDNRIESLAYSGERLYVANMQSRIDVFDISNMNFITRIGTGNWGDGIYQVLHSHAICVKDGRLFVRTKNRLHTYLESDITADKYEKIQWECRSTTDNFGVNNSFNPYQMALIGDKVYVTDMSGMNTLTCIDPALVEAGSEKSVVRNEETIQLDFQPTGLAVHNEERVFIAQNNGKVYVYDFTNKKMVNSFSQVYGDSFKAHKLAFADKYLVITDRVNKQIHIVEVVQNEIKEFD